MKIVFVGTTEFGIPTLEKLKSQFELCFVITTTDKPMGRKKILSPSPVKIWAQSNSIPFYETGKILDLKNQILNAKPDVIVVASYGQMIPDEIIHIPQKGCLNIHPSLLPIYRGPTPIQTALSNGDLETGTSIILMDKQMDHGNILSQKTVKIETTDDFDSLQKKLADVSAGLIVKTLLDIDRGTAKGTSQDDAKASFTKIINFQENRIDWTLDAKTIYKKIQAYKHEPGVWTKHKDKVVKILKCSFVETENHSVDLPGKLSVQNSKLYIRCGKGCLIVAELQAEGKTPISGLDFYNGIQKISDKIFI